MNKEIKELFRLLYADNLSIVGKRKLEKFITNLQQENERLKRRLTTAKKLFKKYKIEKDENLELRKIFELQRRIEKAVEYIEEARK